LFFVFFIAVSYGCSASKARMQLVLPETLMADLYRRRGLQFLPCQNGPLSYNFAWSTLKE